MAEGGHDKALRYLLRAGADPNLLDHNNQTALHRVKSAELVQLLLSFQAKWQVPARLRTWE